MSEPQPQPSGPSTPGLGTPDCSHPSGLGHTVLVTISTSTFARFTLGLSTLLALTVHLWTYGYLRGAIFVGHHDHARAAIYLVIAAGFSLLAFLAPALAFVVISRQYAFVLARRRQVAGCCHSCDYPLRSLHESQACPECGRDRRSRQSAYSPTPRDVLVISAALLLGMVFESAVIEHVAVVEERNAIVASKAWFATGTAGPFRYARFRLAGDHEILIRPNGEISVND